MDRVETGDERWMRGRGKGKSWGKGKGRAGVVHVPANENIYDLIYTVSQKHVTTFSTITLTISVRLQ